MTITYSEPTDIVLTPECHSPQKMGHNDAPAQSEKLDVSCTPSDPATTQPNEILESHASTNDLESHPRTNDLDDDNYLLNPQPHNEHLGVDEEGLYFTHAEAGIADKALDEGSDSEFGSNSDSNSDSDEEYEEEDGLVGKDPLPPHIPVVAYDKDDPPMSVGSIYPNMEVFRLAIAQHAIKKEFEFNIEKSEPGRFIAYCSRKKEGCRWRIHASKMKDNVTIKVKKNPHRHNCCSARRSKQVKNATKFWVCEQVKDWLTEDASLRAKELQRRIKDKHKVLLHYKRVYADAGQGVMVGVKEVFPGAEHKECMFHLVNNFKKRYHGKVFDDHLWSAAYSWHPFFFEKHWKAMEDAKPEAMDYLRNEHTRIWTRSQFSTHCNVEYVTNNLAESFNNWIKKFKGLNLDDFMDKIRQLLMNKWDVRRTVSRKIGGVILPHVIKKLKDQSRNLDMDVQRSGDSVGEVSVKGGKGYKCVVNLYQKTCSCREWQVSGIPCSHAIAFITSVRAPLENYVDRYYFIEKFRASYESLIPAVTDKSQWPESDHGFFMHPPLLKSTTGRRKYQRFKGSTESSGSATRKKGLHQCPICKGYGHRWYNCKDGGPDDIAAMLAERGPPKKRKKTIEPSSENSIVPIESIPTTMIFPPRSAMF